MRIILDVTPESYMTLRNKMVEEAFTASSDDVEGQIEAVKRALFRLAGMAEVDKLKETQELLDGALDAMKDIEMHLIAKAR